MGIPRAPTDHELPNIKIAKYPDRNFNKALIITFQNGTEVVAELPDPNARKPQPCTESKVVNWGFR